MKGYGQYCPVARGAEIFAERWTPLIIRNLDLGCRSFNEIHEGVPKMSRTLLSQRLRQLERRVIVEARPSPSGRGWRYYLTPPGQELVDLTLALGTWAARWLEVGPEHSDPFVVLWGWKKSLDPELLPERRVVVRFELSDRPRERYWLLIERPGAELCVKDPGLDEDVVVRTDSGTLMRVHMGDLTMAEAIARGLWELRGSRAILRGFHTWGGLSRFAGVQPAISPSA